MAIQKMRRPETTTLGVPGDGRCLFRSVVHGAGLRAGKPSPSESLQKELADELRTKVVDEFIKRRADTEWFVEGDFDTYVIQMRQPHIWGGEPELLMSSHVLKMPITVYMWEKNSGGLKIIAEYGQEYGKENPIRVLYHGYGHYDVLRSPLGGAPSKQCLDSLKAKGGDADYRLDALLSSKDAVAGKYLKPLGDDEDSVDQKAERFIQRFYKEMRM